jgi:RND family efflux transporter MFP subunit
MKNTRIILALVALLLTAGLVAAALRLNKQGQAAEQAFAPPLPAVTLLKLEKQTVGVHETFYGLIEPWQEVSLGLQVGGQIEVIGKVQTGSQSKTYDYRLDEESRVKKGQQILRLEDAKVRAQLAAAEASVAQAEASVNEAKSALVQEAAGVEAARGGVAEAEANQQRAVDEFKRVKKLDDQGIATTTEMDRVATERQAADARMRIARASLDQAVASEATSQQRLITANANLASAQAGLNGAKADLAHTFLFSPIDGIISDLPIEEGEIVSAGQTVASVLDVDTVKLVVGIVESKISRIQPGAKAKVTVEATGERANFPAGASLLGEITRVSVASEVNTGLFRVEIRLDNSDGTLRPGMIGRADILVDEVVCYPVPLEATVLRDKQQYVSFAVEKAGEQFSVRTVPLPQGTETDEFFLLDELPDGMSDLIYEGHRTVKDQSQVVVRSRTTLADRDHYQARVSAPLLP